jgi:H/ACA ribonucleoprotein complex subunit 3
MIKKCTLCDTYTISDKCGCGGAVRTAHPPKFSLGDKYAKYRRMAKGN